MERFTKSFKLKGWIIRFSFIILFILTGRIIFAQYGTIDIGIFEATSPANTIEVRLRPDFLIEPDETITGILYTVRWEDPAVSLSINLISPFYVAPQGLPVLNGGYYYQIFASVPFGPVGTTINPGTEVLISSFSFTGGTCGYFEIIENEWTVANNGGVSLEFLGTDVTGIIYEPVAQLGSEGGSVSGGGTILAGQSTGSLTLTAYSGTILNWQKRLNSGTWSDISGTSGLSVFSEVLTIAGTWDYRAVIQRGSCPVDYSTSAQVIVIGASHWTGVVDDNWFLSGNWTYGAPNEYLDAIIPVVDPNPYPFVDGDWNCLNLEIATGASVTVKSTGSLTAHGEFINDGQFTVQSSTSGDGSFIDNGTITGTGNNRVERYIEEEEWHYVSPPISDGLSGIYLDIYLKTFDEEDSTWFYIIPVNIPMIPMKGYAAYATTELTGSKKVYYDGTLNTGSYNINLTNHAGATHHSRGYNFVGNPYPSAINWEEDAGWTKTNLDAAIYIWNPNEGSGQYGTYIYGDEYSGTHGVDSIIPSGQGFFVHVTDGNATGSLNVNNNARLHNSKAFMKAGDKDPDKKYLKLKTYSGSITYTDETIIQFGGNATVLFDPAFDAYKFSGLDEAPQLYSETTDGVRLAVNTNPDLISNTVIPLGFEVCIGGLYSIEAVDLFNFSPNTRILLEDKKEDVTINLIEQSTYTFFSSANDIADRFRVHFLPNSSGINSELMKQNIYIFTDGTEIYIKHSEGGLLNGEITLYDLPGRLVFTERISVFDKYHFSVPNSGVCTVSFADEIEKLVYRKKVLLK
jgi:hypothetical protein